MSQGTGLRERWNSAVAVAVHLTRLGSLLIAADSREFKGVETFLFVSPRAPNCPAVKAVSSDGSVADKHVP